jgi:drug/metabolite transporter (DMT)-like permease
VGRLKTRRVTLTRLVVLALIWGSSFVWIKVGLRGFTPMQMVFLRCLLGAIVLLGIGWLHRLRLPSQPVLWFHFVVAAAVGNVAPFFLFGVGEQSIDSNLAGILNATTPLWTLVLAALTRTERAMSPARALGLLLGLAGAVVIFAPWQLGTGAAGSVLGEAACLVAAVLYGVHFVYAGRFLTSQGLDPIVLSTGQLTAAAVLSALVLPIGWQVPHPQADALASVAVLGVLCTGIAYIPTYRLLSDDGPTVTSIVTYLIPVAAVLFGAALLGESLSLRVLAGMIVVLAGVGLVQHSTARPPAPAAPAGLGIGKPSNS